MQAQLGIAEEYYEDNPNVIILTALADIGQPYSCNQWNNFSPNVTTLIIDDDPGTIFNWFNSENGFPSTVFIDQDMMVRYKTNYINNYYMKGYIDDLLSDCGSDCVSPLPMALFTYEIVELMVTFIDLSVSETSTIIGWHWDFGDGSTSDEQFPPVHTYSTAGTFYVTLDVEDHYGADGLQYWEYITLEGESSCGSEQGDVTGDGVLNILDIVQVANYILGTGTPDYACAADMNADGNVNILDIVQLANAILDN